VVSVTLRLDRRVQSLYNPFMPNEKTGYVYITANKRNGTIYIGVTSDLLKRIWQHKNKVYEGFTTEYGVDRLVYYEAFDDIYEAIKREKLLKFYKREWKIALIEKDNPEWEDLYKKIIW
jgi:putative endonuclease